LVAVVAKRRRAGEHTIGRVGAGGVVESRSLEAFFGCAHAPGNWGHSTHDQADVTRHTALDLRRRRDGDVREAPGLAIHRLETGAASRERSEEHTSELQSRGHLVCRLLLEK